ncbi:hypothetical protein BLA24064_01457 [Burkholderia latens]|nr:hypothetical protein BLA24064_01457 [Burkholderia latens]
MLCVVAIMQWVLVHQLNSAPFVYTFNDKREFVLNLLMLNRTGLEHGFSFNAPSWSISAEFIVNIAFLAAISARKKLSTVLMVAVFLISIAAMYENGLISSATFFGVDNDVFRATFGFCIGVALFRINTLFDKITIPKAAYDLLAIVSTACFMYYCATSKFTSEADLAVTLICFPTLIIGAMRGTAVNKALKHPSLVFLGTISYSIYLVHFPMQLGVHIVGIAARYDMPYSSRGFFVVFVMATICLSWVTYRTIELPGKNLVRRLLGGSSRARPVGQA